MTTEMVGIQGQQDRQTRKAKKTKI
jgi:hypothetical protein